MRCLGLCLTTSFVAVEKGWSCFKPKVQRGMRRIAAFLIEVFVKARNKLENFLPKKSFGSRDLKERVGVPGQYLN